MYEVEVKVRAEHGQVREGLDALGAEPLGRVRQRDTYYDHPARSFVETDEALRLRRESTGDEERVVLTYKGPRLDDDAKTREEVEFRVEDDEAADALLSALGFEPAATVEKERERFAVRGHTVALDKVSGLGEFVEVEAEGEAEEVDALRYAAIELCHDLDLDPDDAIEEAYLELLLASD